MKRFCFALDLKDDVHLISEYKKHHQNVWPEIIASIQDPIVIKKTLAHLNEKLSSVGRQLLYVITGVEGLLKASKLL